MSAGQPLILLYNTPTWNEPGMAKSGVELPCRIVTDRSRLPEADAVVFHLPTMREPFPGRLPGQRWVAWCMEARGRLRRFPNRDFGDRFDITIGYWRDATIRTPYIGPDVEREMRQPPAAKAEAAPLVYFQSSRVSGDRREEFVAQLMRRLPVDSYGKVLNNRSLAGPDLGFQTKRQTIARYKFTLALENWIEDDYVTEKFFDPLIAGSVPVYLGAPNIDQIAPADRCFINAADFDGPDSLVDRLLQLCRDDAAYLSYLAWKERDLRPAFLTMAAQARYPGLHRLCHLLARDLP